MIIKDVVNIIKISVIGAGSWGTALANVVSQNGHEVVIWGRNKKEMEKNNKDSMNHKYLKDIKLHEKLRFTSDIEDAIKDSKVIILAVASQALKQILDKYSYLITDQILVNVSKGIEIDTLKTMDEIIKDFLPGNRCVVLSGPSHAEEVSLNIPTTIVSASKHREDAEFIQDLFTSKVFRVYTNPDILGVELGGALKNIIAIGAGISDGLGYGDNAKAALITRGISEIARLGIAMGAKQATFAGLTGIGDLIVTCTSMHSRNRKCGIALGKGKSLDEAIAEIGMVVEGATTIKAAYQLSEKFDVYMPITAELYKVLYEGQDPRESVSNLMMKTSKHEFENLVDENDWE